MRIFLSGDIFASLLCVVVFYVFIAETKVPDFQNLGDRYQVFEAGVTENQRIVDAESGRTLLWTPGNPKNVVQAAEETETGSMDSPYKKSRLSSCIT